MTSRRTIRGLPRLIWYTRRWWLGRGTVLYSFRGDRFKAYCDTEAYHSVMFAVGIEDRFVDDVLNAVIKPGDIVFDVGANVGMVTLLVASCLRGNGRVDVHCFEPDIRAYRLLERNCRVNGYDSILNNIAVGATEGEADMVMATTLGWSTLAPEPKHGFEFLQKAESRKVPVTTLDAYCQRQGVVPDLIKVDVEGFETNVIQGGERILRAKQPFILMEVNPSRLAAANSSVCELAARCENLGYSWFHASRALSARYCGRSSWRGFPEASERDIPAGGIIDVLAVARHAQ